ncbi:popeye domain cAMP effector bves isoform X2 [Brevipalpus obovatus]|uniref:popeye domain cAMP effector bves isoform X2 n=1 Tax=Brevipalpus obovatus TaxID=246614 RepID=UPI003D9E80C9
MNWNTNISSWINLTRYSRCPIDCDPAYRLVHEPLFQIANAIILFGYLGTTTLHGQLWARVCLFFGSLALALWTYVSICSIDSVIWNLIFLSVHFIYIIIVLRRMHPFIKFPREVELVYRDLFQPLQVSRYAFHKLFKPMREIKTLRPNDLYCIEGKTTVDRLSLLLNGRVAVLKKGRTLHLIDGHQFIDSPEWFGVGSSDTYSVSVVALEECRLLVWHRDKLKLTISGDSYLKSLMDCILGRDLVKKLLFVTDTISNNAAIDQQLNENTKLILPIHRAIDQVVKRETNDR